MYNKLFSNPRGCSLALEKLEKNCTFYQKIAKICDIKLSKTILRPKKFSVTYY